MNYIKEKPLLSICIPTYNRSIYLDKCLTSIVNQDCFDDRVEIVVSDNCSQDNTKDIVRKYQKKFKNIHYYRNNSNVRDMNYPVVLQEATGLLRKLSNDTIIYKSGAIKYILNLIEKSKDTKPQLYFLNNKKNNRLLYISTLEGYIKEISFNLTWIASVSVWDTDIDDLNLFAENTSSRLGQVPFLLNNFEKHKEAIICKKQIMETIPVEKKNISYGLYKVFYISFLGFVKPYVTSGKISPLCYEKVRKDLLLDFFCLWIIKWKRSNNDYLFGEENLQKLIEEEYKDEVYYVVYKIKSYYIEAKLVIKKILKHFNL